MALSGLDIYRLLPKTNCRECGFATCLAFAMQLAKKAATITSCPYLNEEAKRALEAAASPPIKLISIGEGEGNFEVGNETVMFRHEEKFHRPCGIGFIIDDTLTDSRILERLGKINKLKFERVGQELKVNLVALRQKAGAQRFIQALKLISANTNLALVLMPVEPAALKEALLFLKGKKPLVYRVTADNLAEIAGVASEFKTPVVVSAADLEGLAKLSAELNCKGVGDLVLEAQGKSIPEKIWELTQLRRQALKKSNRNLGYPTLVRIEKDDPYEEAIEAATYIAKYAGIVLIKGIETWEVLSLLTLRQNIYTDPQKPLQVEPKLYAVGQVNDKSPVLVTTNFSLSYYTVLGEVEAGKIPAYILSVDTEGMSVLTAWAAEKFTPAKINESINKCALKDAVSHKRIVIPGYVAVISGELEDASGWQVTVGPKEAAGIPSFLKNL